MTNSVLSVQPGHQQYPQSHVNQQRDKDVGFPACRIKRNGVREKERTVFNVAVTIGFAYIASKLGACHTTKPLLVRGAKSGMEATKRDVRQGVCIYTQEVDLPILRAPALGASTLRSDGFPRGIL